MEEIDYLCHAGIAGGGPVAWIHMPNVLESIEDINIISARIDSIPAGSYGYPEAHGGPNLR